MKSLAELATIKDTMKNSVAIREGKESVQPDMKHVLICGGTGCTSSKSVEIKKALEAELSKLGIENEIKVVMTGCFGLCALGPIVIIYPDGTFYSRVTTDDVKEIVEEHLLKGRLVERLVYSDTGSSDDAKVKELVSLGETTF